jgi:hypothetical protein
MEKRQEPGFLESTRKLSSFSDERMVVKVHPRSQKTLIGRDKHLWMYFRESGSLPPTVQIRTRPYKTLDMPRLFDTCTDSQIPNKDGNLGGV